MNRKRINLYRPPGWKIAFGSPTHKATKIETPPTPAQSIA